GLTPKRRSLLKALRDFRVYITTNAQLIPNYGERWRYGEAIATGFVESTVNQVVSKRFVKKQQMRWSPCGAHLLLQTRTRVLNGELRQTFQRSCLKTPTMPRKVRFSWLQKGSC